MARRSKNSGAATPAVGVVERATVDYRLHHYTVDPDASSYGLAAAAALEVSPDRVFKTLLASVDDRLVVAVVPVSANLDLKALASAAGGKKADMAEPDVAERATGYVVGGISPLGQRRRLPTVVDTTLPDHRTVFVSAGRRGLQIELFPTDLRQLTDASTGAISRTGAPVARATQQSRPRVPTSKTGVHRYARCTPA